MDDINDHKYSFALGTMYSSVVGELEKLGDFVMNVMEAKFQRLERAVEPEVIE
jgi:phosphate:Na+ symporter